jgi:hypothetical protein
MRATYPHTRSGGNRLGVLRIEHAPHTASVTALPRLHPPSAGTHRASCLAARGAAGAPVHVAAGPALSAHAGMVSPARLRPRARGHCVGPAGTAVGLHGSAFLAPSRSAHGKCRNALPRAMQPHRRRVQRARNQVQPMDQRTHRPVSRRNPSHGRRQC